MPSKPPTTRQKYGPKRTPRVSPSKLGYDKHHRQWRQLVGQRDNWMCRDCGRPGNEADHIVPLSRGGDWSLENGAIRCKSCHSRKTRDEQLGK